MFFLLKSFKLFYFLCLRDSGNEGSSFCTLIHKMCSQMTSQIVAMIKKAYCTFSGRWGN